VGVAPAPVTGPRPSKRTPRGLIAVIVIVVCLALGVGLFFVIGRLQATTTPPASPPPPTLSPPTETSVPPLTPPWADGYRILWTIPPGDDNPWVWVADQTADRILLRVFSEDTDYLSMVDRVTGQSLWSVKDVCNVPQIVGDEVWCPTDAEKGHSQTNRYDAATGELVDVISIDGLGLIPGAGYHSFNGVFSQYDAPYAEFSDQEDWTGPDYYLARLSADFTSVLWKTHFSFVPSEGFFRSSIRLHHGVLTNSTKYAINADNGTAWPMCSDPNGCSNIEWVADNVLMGQPDKPAAVTFPDNTEGVLTGPGAISVTSNKLPPNPLRWSDGSIEAFDALSGDTYWKTPAPQLYGDIEVNEVGLLSDLYAAYDGQRVVVADMQGHVMAFDPVDGAVLWSVSLPLKVDHTMPDFTDDGLLLIQQMDYAGAIEEEAREGFLYALDPASGAIWWSVEGQVAGKWADNAPFLGDTAKFDGVVVQTRDGTLSHLVPLN